MNQLTEIDVRNFKRIRKAHLTIDRNTLVISGDNGTGKSSFLDAVAALFGGKDKAPPVPVRRGAKEAVIIGRLKTKDGRSLKATVTFTAPNGRRLVVEDEEGKAQSSPQTLLDSFWSETSFDPSLFLASDAKTQVAMLKKLVGLDFTALDKEKDEKYAERTTVNRELDRAKAVAASLPQFPGVPDTEVSSSDVMTSISDAQAWNKSIDEAEVIASGKEQAAVAAKKLAAERYNTYELHLDNADSAQKKHEETLLDVAAAKEQLPKGSEIDLAPLEKQLEELMANIKAAHAHNAKIDEATRLVAERTRTADQVCQATIDARKVLANTKTALDSAHKAEQEASKIALEARSEANKKPRMNTDAFNQKLSEVEATNRKVRANIQHADATKAIKEKVAASDKLTERLEEIDAQKEEMLQKAPFPIPGMSISEAGVILDGLPLEQASDSQKIAIGVEMAAILNPDKPLMLVRHGALFTPPNLKIMDDIAEKRGLTCIVEIPSEKPLGNSSLHFVDGVADSATSTETPAELPLA